jgi:hypothetical protein
MNQPSETRACRFELDQRGFVRATMREGLEMDLADAQEALRATARFCDGGPIPVLVDSRGIKFQTKDAREHFVSEEAEGITSAVALLVGSPVSRMIGNFFIRRNGPRIPTQLFTEEDEAVEWLVGGRR